MIWTFEEISNTCLAGGRIAASPLQIETAFNDVSRLLGEKPIERFFSGPSGPIRGSAPTISVVLLGIELQALKNVQNAEKIERALRNGETNAHSELTTLFLLRNGAAGSEAFYEPAIELGSSGKKADWKVRLPGEPWVFVEVARPQSSEAMAELLAKMNRIGDIVEGLDFGDAVEMYFRREPHQAEIPMIEDSLLAFARGAGGSRLDLAEIGFAVKGHFEPNLFSPNQYEGEEDLPRLGVLRSMMSDKQGQKTIAVRAPFSDTRAEEFLRSEAKQLPTDSPGLIVFDLSGSQGNFRTWGSLLRRRFQPNLHTRVSAICLIAQGILPTAQGETIEITTAILANPFARYPLPQWIVECLSREPVKPLFAGLTTSSKQEPGEQSLSALP